MTNHENTTFRLDSTNTTYAFRVNETGHLEHLYYGKRLKDNISLDVLKTKQLNSLGTGVSYSESNETVFMENICLEISSPGKGDYKNPAIDVRYGNGINTLDFIYSDHKQVFGKPQLDSDLAQSYAVEADASTLIIELKDKALPIYLHLYYTVIQKSDIITRTTVIENKTGNPIYIKNLASLQLDLLDTDWNLVSLDGAWARERKVSRRPVQIGKTILDSTLGVSGSTHSPFFFLERPDCTEQNGEIYGFSLVYSGNFENLIEKTPYGLLRIQSGINPHTFEWKLESGQRFISPEAIMTYSSEGTNGLSWNFHRFVNNHVVRGSWKHKNRPIVFNTWEALGFNYTEKQLLELAKDAKDLGIEVFVLDDGWFGNRDNDKQSLGDWFVNTKKLPEGLSGLSKKIHKLGLQFGIWVEPEMVNRRSVLFGDHPDWAVAIPEREPSLGRHQMILDLTRQDVRDYIVDSMSQVFKESNADYVKWDMNRTFSDIYSSNLENCSSFLHCYIQGLYDILERITKDFPEILFEGCASGGNRFDLGMLCYMKQIWTSDNTDALCRTEIQEGTSYGFPLSSMTNHVTASPNLQTLRQTDMESRFNVAAFGSLGYELDLCSLGGTKQSIIKKQIEFYKENRTLLQYGRFYRLPKTRGLSDRTQWAVTDEEAENILVLDFQKTNIPNSGHEVLKVPFANPNFEYEITERIQNAELGQEKETEFVTYLVSGDILAYAGIPLTSQFGGTGMKKGTRFIPDFGSRIYLIRKVNKD